VTLSKLAVYPGLAPVRAFLASPLDWSDPLSVAEAAARHFAHETGAHAPRLLSTEPAKVALRGLDVQRSAEHAARTGTPVPVTTGESGAGHAILLPIPLEGGRVLQVERRTPFSPGEVELASTLLAVVATAPRRAPAGDHAKPLVEALHRRLAESAALSEVGRAVTGTLALGEVLRIVVREAAELTDATSVSVALLRPDGETVRVDATHGLLEANEGLIMRIDSSLVGWCILHDPVVVTPCISDDPRSRPNPVRHGPAAVVRLVAGGKTLGAMIAARREGAQEMRPEEVAALQKLAAYAAIAIENARLHENAATLLERARSRVDLLSALLESSNRIRVETELSGFLQEVCDAIRETLGWSYVVMTLRDYAGGTTQPVAAAGYDEEEKSGILRRGPSPLSRIETMFREEFRISNSYYIDHRHSDQVRASASFVIDSGSPRDTQEGLWHLEDALLIPVMLRGELLGIISPDVPRNGRQPSLEDVQALELFANQAAVAIENARLYEREKATAAALRDRLAILSALLETGNQLRVEMALEAQLCSICEAIRDTLGWRFVILYLRDPEAGTSRPVATAGFPSSRASEILARAPVDLGDSAAAATWREESRISSSFFVPEVRAEALHGTRGEVADGSDGTAEGEWREGDLLGVPIELRGTVLGLISPHGPLSGKRPTVDDIRALELFANQAAVAIENARLYQEQRETARALRGRSLELESANAELRASQERLLVSEKMAALGRVTAGIAHEINSPLGGILNNLQMARSYAEEYLASAADPEVTAADHRGIAEDLIDTLKLAEQSTRKVGQFVRTIKDQTRAATPRGRERFDPSREIDSTLILMSHTLRAHGLVLHTSVEDGLSLRGDPGKFALVVQNLLSNALDAYDGSPGEMWLRLNRRDGAVILEVEDRGCGIPEEIRGRIFDYLFTTKEVGKGTGLGLSIVHSVVTTHFEGEIEVETEPGAGTTFRVRLPLEGL
jgi:signal transduction histidine kinase